MVSPETSALLAAEEVAELLGPAAAEFQSAKPKRASSRKRAAKAKPENSAAWLPLTELNGEPIQVTRAGKSFTGRLTQRDGVWGVSIE